MKFENDDLFNIGFEYTTIASPVIQHKESFPLDRHKFVERVFYEVPGVIIAGSAAANIMSFGEIPYNDIDIYINNRDQYEMIHKILNECASKSTYIISNIGSVKSFSFPSLDNQNDWNSVYTDVQIIDCSPNENTVYKDSVLHKYKTPEELIRQFPFLNCSVAVYIDPKDKLFKSTLPTQFFDLVKSKILVVQNLDNFRTRTAIKNYVEKYLDKGFILDHNAMIEIMYKLVWTMKV